MRNMKFSRIQLIGMLVLLTLIIALAIYRFATLPN